ncbi:DUF1102 domain-containing protein [Haloplanus salinarum]|uniref:DUF1102 domain-containing protein n=1 Tax=Haloplanus salinarum TaxID=1912324 RepID=UPI00214CCEAA|nr:DUF1102 domain-containing protein [Haloplanus salinarum]
MERRKFIATMGSIAAGGAATVGTGAFTSVEANRTVNVNVADDTNAYVGLRATSDPNGQFASGSSSDEITIDFDSSGSPGSGSGVNPNAETVFEEVFQIENQGTQNVEVDLSSSSSPSITIQDPGDIDVDGISGDGVAAALSTDDGDTDGTVELDEGEKVDVDFAVDSGTSDLSGLTLTVEADAV